MIEVKSDYDDFQRVNKNLTSVVPYQDDDTTTKSEENKMESMTAMAREFLLFIVTVLSCKCFEPIFSFRKYDIYMISKYGDEMGVKINMSVNVFREHGTQFYVSRISWP